jgi:phosphopantetheinyl transferase
MAWFARRPGVTEVTGGLPHVRLLVARTAVDRPALRSVARILPPAALGRNVSRSYSHPLALVAWHDQPVGVDIERIAPCPPEFASVIRTPLERLDARACATDEDLIDLWCGKEALAKALGDARAFDPARLPSPKAWPLGGSGPWRAAPLAVPGPHVAWVVWRAKPVR